MEKLMVINIKTNNVVITNMQSCISDIAVGVILDKWSRKFCFRNCYAFVSMTSITMVEGQYG
ncbi:hypothetical protein T09_15652 [Trichinella sp. T9]|nr:hypothetical protein T09_15652 [Trichinella sp. T9]